MRLLFFAWVRERIGRDEETLDPPLDVTTVAQLIAWLGHRGGGYAEAFLEPTKLRCAIDQNFVGLDSPIAGAEEIALFPPVTGG